jgi:DNA-binding XRE family transcriptional regulator
MDADQPVVYDVWDAAPLALPARSRLFHLAPVGVGTAAVESLTGYVARLAELHGVRPRHLVAGEILPLLGPPRLAAAPFPSQLSAFWRNETHACNGIRTLARDLVRALETLTGRRDLRFLTLLPWAEVLALQQLQRPTRAFCPPCFEERRRTGQVVHEPLLWTLTAVTACPRHRRRLRRACPYPDCRYVSSWLSARSRPGYCARCLRWQGRAAGDELGAPDALTEEELTVQAWVWDAVGALLAAAPALPVPPGREQFLRTLGVWTRSRAPTSRQAWARRVGLTASAVGNWEAGHAIPSLWYLLQVCRHLGTTPLAVVTGAVPDASHPGPDARASPAFPARPVRARKPFDPEATRRALEDILASAEQPPPSLREVERRLDQPEDALRRHLPELCHAISERYLRDRKAHGRRARQTLRDEARQATYQVHAQGRYPSAHRVAPLLSQPDSLRGGVAKAAWQEALRELGWLGGTGSTAPSV